MGIRKYKYYFKKPKSEIVKDLLKFLAVSGAFIIAGSSEKFWWDLWLKILGVRRKSNKYSPKKVYDNFYLLLKRGFIKVERRRKQIYISLTDKGRLKTGWLQINDLKIKKPRKWDGKWRILIFDISQMKKFYREALRGKLKELNFYSLQKSVWICPFDCRAEVELLQNFFGFSSKEMRLIIAEDIGPAETLRKFFKI